MTNKCALCQNTRKLCKSHIIPEFFYKALYDKKHRFKAINSVWRKVLFYFKGAREHLLCEDCEGKLSIYEKYLSDALLEQYPKIMKIKVKDMLYFNIDYKEGRLCYLSILWRMSIATGNFFVNFSIPEHAARLRDLINNDDPGNSNEFGCIAIAPLINGSFRSDWFLNPHRAKIDGDDICFVIFGGILYIFFITFVNNQKSAEAFIQRENKWLITGVNAKEIPFLDRYFSDAQKIIKKYK